MAIKNKKCDNVSFEKSGFDAYTQEKLTRNFTWIHFCPQEILSFDDDTPQENKYYVLVLESIEEE